MPITRDEVTLYTTQYRSVYDMLPQDKGSKLLKYVSIETGLKGESAVPADQIGKTEVNEDNTVFGDSPYNNVATARRWYRPRKFNWGHPFPDDDKVRMIGDPQNAIAVSARNAFGRKLDDVIVESFFAQNRTGKDGETLTSFDSNNIIAHGDAGFTVEKLLAAKERYRNLDVDIDNERPVVILSPKAERQLFKQTEYVSGDYGKPVMDDGKIKSFLGFDFVIMNRLPEASNIRSCPVFVKSAVGVGFWKDLKIELDKRPDKQYVWYLYMEQMYSATRLYEEGCLNIQVKETA